VIGVPFDNNDLMWLGAITEVVAHLVARGDPLLLELAEQYLTTKALAARIHAGATRVDAVGADSRVPAQQIPGQRAVDHADPVHRRPTIPPDPDPADAPARRSVVSHEHLVSFVPVLLTSKRRCPT
jgi:hypothetical protein